MKVLIIGSGDSSLGIQEALLSLIDDEDVDLIAAETPSKEVVFSVEPFGLYQIVSYTNYVASFKRLFLAVSLFFNPFPDWVKREKTTKIIVVKDKKTWFPAFSAGRPPPSLFKKKKGTDFKAPQFIAELFFYYN